jgi:hypothetical protein
MKREDWQQRLKDYLRSIARTPFYIGRHDCATFTAAAVEAMTGRDYMRGFRGYRTIEEGLRNAQAKGFADHIAVVAASFDEVSPSFAQVGDIAVVDGIGGDALGIVQGANVYTIGATGLGIVPITAIKRAFRVA